MATRNGRGWAGRVSAGVLLALIPVGSLAGQVTSRVSVDSSGTQGNLESYYPSISANGRYVAFQSAATNLVGGDTNASFDGFVHDRASGTTERVSVDSLGAQGNLGSYSPSISADGRYVTFVSFATNLVAGDTNLVADVFVRDRQSGATARVSVSSLGAQGNDDCALSSISADGRYVAFQSAATNLVSGDTNGYEDIFVHDRASGTTARVSVDSGGGQASAQSYNASISADGSCVTFQSDASDLVGGDTNVRADVFVHDRASGITERVSVDSLGGQGDGHAYFPTISTDGRYVVFYSYATNLVGGDTNGAPDVFVHDRANGTTERVSVTSGGTEGNSASYGPSISADGRYVAFASYANNLVAGDTNTEADVFVRDQQTGTIERVSLDSSGAQGNGSSFEPSVSADGRFVAFGSLATNLVDGDTNGVPDTFVRDRGERIGTKYCIANANSTGAPADLSAFGSSSSGAGDLSLASIPVPDQNGVFFHGANPAQVPFGNGFLCTNGGIVRGAVVKGAGNVATYAYDNSDAKHSLAAFVGSTRHFQHWFRDPAAGGAFFNTSNAISISIAP